MTGEPSVGADAAWPLVAVLMTALNEEGKIGRTVDGIPRDGRFEPIVIDDGSSDGTGDEARSHGAIVLRHDVNQGVGAGLRTGIAYARQLDRKYIAFFAGDDQHVGSDLVGALDAVLERDLDYLQGSRWMPGGKVVGPTGGRGFGTRLYSLIFSALVFKHVTDATNGFRIFRTTLIDDPRVDITQRWLDRYELEPYLLWKAIRGDYRFAEFPVTVRYHGEGYTKMRGIRDWWRLIRPGLMLRLRIKH